MGSSAKLTIDGSPQGFTAWRHCSYYPMSGSITEALRDELAGHETSKGAIHFQPDAVLPTALVRKLVKARIAEAFDDPKASQARPRR